MSNLNQSLCSCGCCEELKKFTPQELVNLPGLAALHYRVGTHSSFKHSMIQQLSRKQSLAKLTSRYDDDMAIATLDACACVLDVLAFYQERIINEGYLRTATERLSILELARHISYKLGPGVASSTYLAFSMNEAKGAPASAVIPIGTKVQSIPGQDQLPQVFETIEELEARVDWNAIKVQTNRKNIPVFGDKEIYLKGINTGLQSGDGILMIGDERLHSKSNEHWDFRKIQNIFPDNKAGITKVTWEEGLGTLLSGVQIVPAAKNFKVYALRQRAFLFGYNSPDFRVMSEEIKDVFNPSTNTTNDNIDWKNFNIKSVANAENIIHLEGIYPKIIKDGWLVMMTSAYSEVYQIENAVESSRKDFTLTSKTTEVKLSGENLFEQFDSHIRDAMVYAQSEELEIAEMPVEDFLQNDKEIRLEKLLPDLPAEKNIIISGKRKRLLINESNIYPLFIVPRNNIVTRRLTAGDSLIVLKKPEIILANTKWTLMDNAGFVGTIEGVSSEFSLEAAKMEGGKFRIIASEKDDSIVSEFHTIESLKPGTNPTVIILKDLVKNIFDPPTVYISANIASSTHGETKQETLGSGNGSQVFQKFVLKQNPLTFISASSPSGTQTTLQVRVNDVLWQEVLTLYGVTAKEKVYITRINDEGKVTVQFGDGITGSRLPTGTENIRATYRVGIGYGGLLIAEQLSMLLTPQLGVNKVVNPLETSGAEDPENRDSARKNAPLTVLTLDRIVSAKDFEDFTRAFAGIGKARADILWNGEKQVVYITVAAADKGPVDKKSKLYENLLIAFKNSGHSNNIIYVENYNPHSFSVNARIKIDSDYEFEKVKMKMFLALKDVFSFEKREFGQDVTPAEIIAIIQGIEGVIYTDLELLNGKNPFSIPHFRIVANIAQRINEQNLPADLLVINENEINITQISK